MLALKLGPSYTTSDLGWDAQRTVNLVPELDDTGDAKAGVNIRLMTAPGTSIAHINNAYCIRGLFKLPTGVVVAIFQNTTTQRSNVAIFNESTGTFTTVRYAVLNPDTSENHDGWALANIYFERQVVRGAFNGTHLVVVDGSGTKIKIDLTDETLGYKWDYLVADGSVSPMYATDVAFIGGYFVFSEYNWNADFGRSDKFYISGLYDTTMDPLDVATTEYKADGLVAVGALSGSLWLFGARTMEVWANTGGTDFPFERIMGASSDTGILNRASLQQLADAFVWLACTSGGRPFIAMTNGYSPVKISTTAIDNMLGTVADWTSVSSFVYTYKGHYYYGLNVPALGTTFVYDLHSKMWHERTGYNFYTAGQTSVAYSHSSPGLTTEHLVFRPGEAGVLKLDNASTLLKTMTEPNGTQLQCMRLFPIVADSSLVRLRHNLVQLDASAGDTANQPAYTLQWSDDSGRNFNAGRTLQPADVGEYTERFIWRRLGMSRSRLYKLSFSTSIHVSIRSASLDVDKLNA